MSVINSIIIFGLRVAIIGCALTILFIRLELFEKMNNEQIMAVGMASTPMFISLFDFLLGLVFIGWPSWFYYILPVGASILLLSWNKNYRIIIESIISMFGYLEKIVMKVEKWIYFDLFLSSVIVVVYMCEFNNMRLLSNYINPILVSLNEMGRLSVLLLFASFISLMAYVIRKMHSDGTLKLNCYFFLTVIAVVYSVCFGMSFIGRTDTDPDRAHYQLNARYFAEDRNSWELDNYSGEKYGSSLRDDHGPLWSMYLADAQMQADLVGMDEPYRICNFAIFWAYCCFNILMVLTASLLSNTYTAGIVSFYLFNLYEYVVLMIMGSRDGFRFACLLTLVLYLFCVLPIIIQNNARGHHYFFMFLFCYLSMNGHEGNVYIMLGMFIVVAVLLIVYKTPIKAMVLCGVSVFIGTLFGISKTISLYMETGRLSSTTGIPFHDTPVIEQAREINRRRGDWSTILATYTKEVIFMILLGILALIIMIAVSIVKQEKSLFFRGMIFIGMLVPMTGVMNWIGYDVPRWFAEQLRYRMYFLMIFAITGSWLLTRHWTKKSHRHACLALIAVTIMLYLNVECKRVINYSRQYIVDCVASIARYRNLADTVANLTDGNVFTANQVILYYLHGTPKLLYHVNSEDLIQAKTDDEIEYAMNELNLGAILLPENGLDYLDYSLLPFWKYINEDQSFAHVVDKNTGYVIYYRIKWG